MDIRATGNTNSDIADDILPIHGISGTDIVACFYGIGNTTSAIKKSERVVFVLLYR